MTNTSLALKKFKKQCNMLKIILVQGFCPLKIKITQFPGGFCLKINLTLSKGGAVVHVVTSHQCGLGSNPGIDAICWLSLWLVLSLALRGVSLDTKELLSAFLWVNK